MNLFCSTGRFPIVLPRVLKGWDSCLTRTFLLASEVLLQVKGQTLLTVCQGFRETACHSSVVEIKYHEQDNLYEKEFILTHGSGRGGDKVWWEAESKQRVSGTGN